MRRVVGQLIEKIGAPGKTRTPNLLIRSQTLYPIELRARRSAASRKRRAMILDAREPPRRDAKLRPRAALGQARLGMLRVLPGVFFDPPQSG